MKEFPWTNLDSPELCFQPYCQLLSVYEVQSLVYEVDAFVYEVRVCVLHGKVLWNIRALWKFRA